MKKILLLLIPFFGISQTATEVRLSSYEAIGDASIQNFIASSNITYYPKNIHPCHPGEFTFDFIGADASTVTAALNGNPLVTNIIPGYYGMLSYGAMAKLQTAGVGVPTGTENGVIVTNSPELNAVFAAHNVCYYSQYVPTSQNAELLKIYEIYCDCDANSLINALEGLTTVFEQDGENTYGPENIPYAILDTPEFASKKPVVYPNPFSSTFAVESNLEITEYSLFDLSGKTLAKTSDMIQLQSISAGLQTGVYVLLTKASDGSRNTQRIVKK